MNERNNAQKEQMSRIKLLTLIFVLAVIVSCGGPAASGPAAVSKFEKAGVKHQLQTMINRPDINNAGVIYIIAIGDVLEIQMPVILKDIIALPHENEPYLCRVNESGNIPLPIVGMVSVVGQTLTEAEQTTAKAYYPQYVQTQPAVVCKVREHIETRTFTVTGLVKLPGIFPYPTNIQYSLVDVIAGAGGIDLTANPRYAKIYRRDSTGNIVSAIFKIDKSSMDKASKVIIKPGDLIALEPTLQTQTNLFLSQVFRINVGTYVNSRDF